jgi:hypothetical protein
MELAIIPQESFVLGRRLLRDGRSLKHELERRSECYGGPLLEQFAALLLDAHNFIEG